MQELIRLSDEVSEKGYEITVVRPNRSVSDVVDTLEVLFEKSENTRDAHEIIDYMSHWLSPAFFDQLYDDLDRDMTMTAMILTSIACLLRYLQDSFSKQGLDHRIADESVSRICGRIVKFISTSEGAHVFGLSQRHQPKNQTWTEMGLQSLKSFRFARSIS